MLYASETVPTNVTAQMSTSPAPRKPGAFDGCLNDNLRGTTKKPISAW